MQPRPDDGADRSVGRSPHLLHDVDARIDGRCRFKAVLVGLRDTVEEIMNRVVVPDVGIAERFDGMLQLVPHRRQQFVAVPVRIDHDAQNSIGASHSDDERQAGADTMTALPGVEYTMPSEPSISSTSRRNVVERSLASRNSASREASPFARTRGMGATTLGASRSMGSACAASRPAC